jgi:hypothetical protein
MPKTNHEILDLKVNKVSLVKNPANGEEILTVEKDVKLCPVGRAIHFLEDLRSRRKLNPDQAKLIEKMIERLRKVDKDHCASGSASIESESSPSKVKEAIELMLIAEGDQLHEALGDDFWHGYNLVKDLDTFTITEASNRLLRESARILGSADDKGWEWDVVIIESGDSKNGVWNGNQLIPRHYPLDVLKKHVNLFEGAKVYVYEFKDGGKTRYDHLTEQALEANPQGYAKNLVGWISRPRIEGSSLVGTVRLLKSADWLRTNLQDSMKAGQNLYGLSIDAEGSQHLGRVGGQQRLIVDGLRSIRSVDVVTYPAAGGRFLRLVASRDMREIHRMNENLLERLAKFEERQLLNSVLRESGLPALEQAKIRQQMSNADHIDFDRLEEAILEAHKKLAAKGNEYPYPMPKKKADDEDESYPMPMSKMRHKEEEYEKYGMPKSKAKKDKEEADGYPYPMPKKKAEEEGYTGVKEVNGRFVAFKDGKIVANKATEEEAQEALSEMKESWIDRQLKRFAKDLDSRIQRFEAKQKLQESQNYLFTAVQQSGLPYKAQEKLLRQFKGRIVEAAQIDREIEDMRELVAAADDSGELRIGGQVREVRVTESEWDKLTTALDGFWANQDLKGRDGTPVRRMRSLQEAYELMTRRRYNLRDFMRESLGLPGQRYDSAGRYGVQAGTRMTEALTTSSWAQILGDSITRRMLAEYNIPSLQAWRQIVSEISNIKDFRTQRRMRIGGYGLLPVVGQGDSYTPLTSPNDEEATYAISKRGGIETVTLEMIANDDVGAIRRIPLRLGRAAAQTLFRAVFDLIINNVNVSFTDDTGPLFSTAHANLGTAALSPDSLEAAISRMKRQAAYNNATEPLGLVPRFILHPPELWRTVKKLIMSERGEPFTTDNDINPFLDLKLQPIEIYYWTDTNNWYLTANPSDVPTIEVGFFEGNEDPEIFVSDQENISNSSMFNADKITYKIRHIYGVGILDYRGFDGSIVP